VHRTACLLIASLAGCDTVWGLERGDAPPAIDTNDEDEDGISNSDDPCPHLADQTQTDADKDGIPEICDSDDQENQTVAVFFGFDSATVPTALDIQGSVTHTDVTGTVTFGRLATGLDTITLKGVMAKTALIDVGFEIVDDTVEAFPPTTDGYNEIGLYTANESYTPATRGDVCFFGSLMTTNPDPLYTELGENAGTHQTKSTAGGLKGTKGRMRLTRTTEKYECSVFRTGMGMLVDSKNVEALQDASGRIGFSTEKLIVRLRYIYIAYQPVIRL
jgi:hypothetical protein